MRKDRALLLLLSNPRVISLHYSPSISRTIPVPVAVALPRLLNEWLVVGFVSGILLFLIVTLGLEIREQVAVLAGKQATHTTISTELRYWQGMTRKYPDYRDGYFRQALLQYELGNEQLAEMNIEQVLRLDPNFTPARSFQEKLAKK